jgi:glycosyltransferase involved in cell wall biosynthesis
MDLEWDWVVVATPRALADSPFFQSFAPVVVSDAPLSYHVSWRLGRLWAKANCALGLATAFFAPLIGPPVVTNYFDANAYHPVRDFRTSKDWLKSQIVQGLWNLSRKRSRALFILSEYGRRRMIEADPPTAEKWVVAPCGCALMPRVTAKPAWAERLRERPFVLYAGAFSENKNQRRVIQAWDQLRRQYEQMPSLVLIGPGPPDYLKEVIEPLRAQSYRPDEIILPGFVPPEDLAWAFWHAHAYIQPSFAEGFGMPVVEAMSCELPVACSDSTSLPEVAGGAAILFDPADVTSMAKALEVVVFDDVRRAALKRAGQERAKTFTWERHAEIVAGRIRDELARVTL